MHVINTVTKAFYALHKTYRVLVIMWSFEFLFHHRSAELFKESKFTTTWNVIQLTHGRDLKLASPLWCIVTVRLRNTPSEDSVHEVWPQHDTDAGQNQHVTQRQVDFKLNVTSSNKFNEDTFPTNRADHLPFPWETLSSNVPPSEHCARGEHGLELCSSPGF